MLGFRRTLRFLTEVLGAGFRFPLQNAHGHLGGPPSKRRLCGLRQLSSKEFLSSATSDDRLHVLFQIRCKPIMQFEPVKAALHVPSGEEDAKQQTRLEVPTCVEGDGLRVPIR